MDNTYWLRGFQNSSPKCLRKEEGELFSLQLDGWIWEMMTKRVHESMSPWTIHTFSADTKIVPPGVYEKRRGNYFRSNNLAHNLSHNLSHKFVATIWATVRCLPRANSCNHGQECIMPRLTTIWATIWATNLLPHFEPLLDAYLEPSHAYLGSTLV